MEQTPIEKTICVWTDQGQDAEFAAIHGALHYHLGFLPLMIHHAQCTQLPRKDFPNQYTLLFQKQALGIIRKIYRLGNDRPFKVSFTPLPILN